MLPELLDRPQLLPQRTTVQKPILIIDDDEALVEALSRRLAQQGFETISASSGEEGLRRAKCDSPTLIVLDIRLPDASGLDVCQQLVDSAKTCDIPVIILSGMERPDIIRRCRTAGCQYFLRKPYDPNALLVLIRQAITENRSWSE
jgi:DNA-binding response OmpR family regulator